MPSNREILAKEISDRFITAISGTDKQQFIGVNPEDRIFVGKLSPKSAEDAFSSSVLIKQISVDFRIPADSIEHASITIFPQGNFFYRIQPSFEQQRDAFFQNFKDTFQDIRVWHFCSVSFLR